MKTFIPRLSGTTLKRLGATLRLAVPFLVLAGLWILGESRQLAGGIVWVYLAILLTAAWYLRRTGADWYSRGKQLCAPSAKNLVSTDTRPPVVYLRSFQDDSIAAQGEMQYGFTPQGHYELSWAPETEEEQLAQVMNEIGPFVALGRPGEALPGVGAARMYLEQDEWKNEVLKLISCAKLVVLRAAETPSFLWEFEAVVKNVAPEKIVVLFPFEAPQYQAFREKLQRTMHDLPFRLPLYFGELRQRGWAERAKDWLNKGSGCSIHCILYFGPQWECRLLELRDFGGQIPNPLAQAFKITLEPVFKQLGVPWKKRRWFSSRYRV